MLQKTNQQQHPSAKQNIVNFHNCDTVSDEVNNQCIKSNLTLKEQQQEQEEIKKAKLVCQLKEIHQQYTVFSATKHDLVQSDKGTKKARPITNEVKNHAHCL